MHTLANKTAVVTGGNSGIGYATAKELKNNGANVIITGRRKEAVDKAAAELGVTGIVADQSNLADTEQLVAAVQARYGKVDILFINAGISGLSTIEAATEKHFDDMMNINLKGAYFTLSRFIPILEDGGTVIFLSSIVANIYGHSSSVYSSSKAALNSVMKIAAVELAPRKIRVNAVSPGPIKTSIMEKAGLDEATLDHIKNTLVGRIPMARMGEAAEVARLTVFLASDASGYITGSEFIIDGGMTLNA